MADSADPEPSKAAGLAVIETARAGGARRRRRGPPSERKWRRRSRARTLNLGVLHAQAERFARAAELFEKAAALDPALPQVQSSLGVAYFNARQFDKATGPLARALAARPGDAGLKRMLALAWLNLAGVPQGGRAARGRPRARGEPVARSSRTAWRW